MPSYKYPHLNDDEWLYTKYVIEGMGTSAIALLLGIKSSNSVREALIRANIPVRDFRESQIYNRDDDGFIINYDVITGCLLGDGYLRCYNKNSEYSAPYFSKTNKFKDHIQYVASKIYEYNQDNWISLSRNKCNGKVLNYWSIRTLSHDSLTPLYNKWYPLSNNRRKTIPDDLIITPDVMLHWFLDDGSTYQRKRKTKQVYGILCTECFTLDEHKLLQEKVKHSLGLNLSISKINYGTGYRLTIKQSEIYDFYETIGPCPVDSLKYKWK